MQHIIKQSIIQHLLNEDGSPKSKHAQLLANGDYEWDVMLRSEANPPASRLSLDNPNNKAPSTKPEVVEQAFRRMLIKSKYKKGWVCMSAFSTSKDLITLGLLTESKSLTEKGKKYACRQGNSRVWSLDDIRKVAVEYLKYRPLTTVEGYAFKSDFIHNDDLYALGFIHNKSKEPTELGLLYCRRNNAKTFLWNYSKMKEEGLI